MADYSPHVLERARENVKEHADALQQPGRWTRACRPRRWASCAGKAFLIYISNVYDNLPTDEIVRIGGHMYQVEVRAYIPPQASASESGETCSRRSRRESCRT